MTLDKCLEHIDDTTKWDVRFYEDCSLCEPTIHTTTDNIDALYRDWYDECNNCPENDAYVYGVTFGCDDGRVLLVNNSGTLTFEMLMRKIESAFYKA